MKFSPTPLANLWLMEPDLAWDERGAFGRVFCSAEFAGHGITFALVQSSISFNPRKGTLRGLHWQAAPHGETKLVRCTRGAIFDVAVDLRPGSLTFRHWYATTLSAENRRQLLIPRDFAHGFQTLVDETEVVYQMDAPYSVASARGARWNDPAFQIQWPDCPSRIISTRDAGYPEFTWASP